ncbi:hypothetical protein EMCG_02031 [[Emmonsia] crescens]|uniref:Uncharacterized protein n=1 Tax=[Emmonsia] crescens TaxID=73230 RepID=A0A0G2HZV8_9EURO|nr:hypothetical protein EMCG_02031 [Emmonsia crescens UAMH 3008]
MPGLANHYGQIRFLAPTAASLEMLRRLSQNEHLRRSPLCVLFKTAVEAPAYVAIYRQQEIILKQGDEFAR